MGNEAIAVLVARIKLCKSWVEDDEVVVRHFTEEIEKAKTNQILHNEKIKQLEDAIRRLNE